MTASSDIDDLAGEFVLGTLDASERAMVQARRLREPELETAIARWETLLSPLDELATAVPAPAELRAKVLYRIGRLTPDNARPNVFDLQQRISRWRTAAFSASALAACLAGFIVVRENVKPAVPNTYVAVLQKDAQSPAFMMTVDLDTKTFSVRAVAPQQLPDKSYELWLIAERLGAPRSLGVVGDQAYSVSARLAVFASGDIEAATYAVTVEPPGGSPSGAPTGPVVYAGKLFQAKP